MFRIPLSLCRTSVSSITSARSAHVFKKTRFPKKWLTKVKKEDATQENLNEMAKKGRPWEDLVVKDPFEELLTYEVVEEEQEPHKVRLILVKNSEDFGKKGQVVTVDDPVLAKQDLLLPGLAVYATDKNMEKYKDILIPEEKWKFSSEYIKQYLPELTRKVLPVTMNLHHEWTLEPFHIRVCFQRLRVEVPTESIEMPPREITGPNLDYQGKEFYVHIRINNFERIPIRCVINHRSDDPIENEKFREIGWQHRFHEPIFEEDGEFLAKMKRTFIGPVAEEQPDFQPHMEKYKEWKRNRYNVLQE